jgi:hypothetical protein
MHSTMAPVHQLKARPSRLFALSELCQASQAVLACAFQLHILGLNARVLAARLGDEARGFATLSGEWVSLGRQLDEQMHHLEQVSEKLVRIVGQQTLLRRRQHLLDACEADERVPVLRRQLGVPRALGTERLALRQLVAEALRSCTFGIVIARSAKIEAAWSSGARAALSNLAVEFEVQLSTILPALRRLAVLESKELS